MPDGLTDRALKRLEILPGQRVLDLGCGDGVHAQQIGGMSPGISVALDLDRMLLQNLTHSALAFPASSGMDTLSPVCADALRLPFPEATFDRVICSLVLYLLPFQAALVELSRVVKIGGRVYLRLPMLTRTRVLYVLQYVIRDPRKSVYAALLTLNGLWYSLSGRQSANPFLRHEQMAFFVPKKRFEEAAGRAGFRIECFEIDKPRPFTAAIDAWLTKTS